MVAMTAFSKRGPAKVKSGRRRKREREGTKITTTSGATGTVKNKREEKRAVNVILGPEGEAVEKAPRGARKRGEGGGGIGRSRNNRGAGKGRKGTGGKKRLKNLHHGPRHPRQWRVRGRPMRS